MTPQQILDEALQRHHQSDGWEGDLTEAAYRLEQLDSWSVLKDFVCSGVEEIELFLNAVVRKAPSEKELLEVLLVAARNPDPDVRSRLLELTTEFDFSFKSQLITAVADSGFDDQVTDRAIHQEYHPPQGDR